MLFRIRNNDKQMDETSVLILNLIFSFIAIHLSWTYNTKFNVPFHTKILNALIAGVFGIIYITMYIFREFMTNPKA